MSDNILEYNGGSVLAMAGKNSVAIATDMRFGVRNQTVAFDCSKVHQINESIFIGLPGLISDAQTLLERLRYKVNIYVLEEESIKPQTLANMVMSMLYEKRFGPFFVEPIVVGLNDDHTPYMVSMDLIGAQCNARDFVTAGSSSEAIFGLAETLWRPDMDVEELFEVISQTFLNALDRDAISGWGARVYIITPENIIIRDLKCRQD